jgi:hypothetical protein
VNWPSRAPKSAASERALSSASIEGKNAGPSGKFQLSWKENWVLASVCFGLAARRSIIPRNGDEHVAVALAWSTKRLQPVEYDDKIGTLAVRAGLSPQSFGQRRYDRREGFGGD